MDLRSRLKQRRAEEAAALPPSPRSELVTPKDIAYRIKRAASPLADTSHLCSVCEINHTTFKYFLTRKCYFPICGNCMFNTNMDKLKGMSRAQAILTLKRSPT